MEENGTWRFIDCMICSGGLEDAAAGGGRVPDIHLPAIELGVWSKLIGGENLRNLKRKWEGNG